MGLLVVRRKSQLAEFLQFISRCLHTSFSPLFEANSRLKAIIHKSQLRVTSNIIEFSREYSTTMLGRAVRDAMARERPYDEGSPLSSPSKRLKKNFVAYVKSLT